MIKNKYFTTTQASKITGFSADHLRKLILQGRIKAEKVGKVWFIKEKELAFIPRRRQNTNKET